MAATDATSGAGAPARIDLLDALRGWALFGLLMVHSVEYFELHWLDPHPSPAFDLVFALFAGKAFALFALCFGVSFAIIMASAARRGEAYGGRFAWRLVLLFAIGTLHGLVYRGEVLQVLALLGLALIPLHAIRSPRVLIVLAVLLLAQLPLIATITAIAAGVPGAGAPLLGDDPTMILLAKGGLGEVMLGNATWGTAGKWAFYLESGRLVQILGLFVVGMLLGRAGFFAAPQSFLRERRIALALALAAMLLLYFVGTPIVDAVRAGSPELAGPVRRLRDSWAGLAGMTVHLLLFVELFEATRGRALRWLAPAGRMTLTLYVGQSLVLVPVYYGFGLGLYGKVDHLTTIAIGLAAFAVQIGFATLWFRRFRYGPLEWLWRSATRMERVPLRRAGA